MHEIKEGAEVVRYAPRTGQLDAVAIARVERVTATQAILPNGERFRLTDGSMVAKRGRWSARPSISADPGKISAARRQIVRGNIEYRLGRIRWSEIEAATLVKIAELLKFPEVAP